MTKPKPKQASAIVAKLATAVAARSRPALSLILNHPQVRPFLEEVVRHNVNLPHKSRISVEAVHAAVRDEYGLQVGKDTVREALKVVAR
jgi:hypothetical protein